MTSVVRQPLQRPVNTTETKFTPIRSPCWYDNNLGAMCLIPFEVSKEGVLDIRVQDDSLLNIQGGALGYATGDPWLDILCENPLLVQPLGGLRTVTSLGPYFKSWFQNFLGQDYSSGGPPPVTFTIQQPVLMTKVQQVITGGDFYQFDVIAGEGGFPGVQNLIRATNAVTFSQDRPASDDMISNTAKEQNKYLTAWVFKTPLVLSVGPYSFTFNTQFRTATGVYQENREFTIQDGWTQNEDFPNTYNGDLGFGNFQGAVVNAWANQYL